jgi:hypothetical protein
VIKHVVEVTPTVSTSAYTANDQVGGLMTLDGAAPGKGAGTVLNSIVIVDKASQAAEIDLYFFDESPTVASSDNAAADVTDAEMVDKCIGHVTVVAGDYAALAANSTACVRDIALSLKPRASTTLYCLAVTRGTPTYGSTSDLTLKFVFDWE